ncbi:hypothetical protein Tco_0272973 [Tanacetum coccineum]
MATLTMEEYMAQTRDDIGTSVMRPVFKDATTFDLKGRFLKELRESTFSEIDNEDANEHIEKVLEVVDLFHIYRM